MIDMILLGTAAAAPRPGRGVTSAVLRCAGRCILFDCGEGVQTALQICGVNLMRIDMICLSHYHGDHIFGLPGLLQLMGLYGRRDALIITGPAGLEEAMAPVLTLAEAASQPYPIRVMPLPAGPLPLHDICPRWPESAFLSAFPTEHRVSSQGYRFHLQRMRRLHTDRAQALGIPQKLWRKLQLGQAVTHEGRCFLPDMVCGTPRRGLTVVFSGDTRPCAALEDAARDADLLLMEATYPSEADNDKAALYGHSTFPATAALAARAGVHRLWLIHFSGSIRDPEEALPAARAHYPGAICGHDGMTATLTFEDGGDTNGP